MKDFNEVDVNHNLQQHTLYQYRSNFAYTFYCHLGLSCKWKEAGNQLGNGAKGDQDPQ